MTSFVDDPAFQETFFRTDISDATSSGQVCDSTKRTPEGNKP